PACRPCTTISRRILPLEPDHPKHDVPFPTLRDPLRSASRRYDRPRGSDSVERDGRHARPLSRPPECLAPSNHPTAKTGQVRTGLVAESSGSEVPAARHEASDSRMPPWFCENTLA